MTSSNPSANEAQDSSATVARIEAQDAVWASPVREYLERNGCRVRVNSSAGRDPDYLICTGDTEFVKAFFDRIGTSSARKLAIVYGGDEDALEALASIGVKQYFLDPKPIGEADAHNIFAYFFTGTEKRINVRKERSAPVRRTVIQREVQREPAQEIGNQADTDRRRIARAMSEAYDRPTVHHTAKRRIPRLSAIVFGVFVSVIAPILFYSLSLAAGIVFLFLSVKSLAAGNARRAQAFSSYGQSYLQAARGILYAGSPVLNVLGQGTFVADHDRLFSVLSQVTSVESGVLRIFDASKIVAAGILFPDGTQHKAGVSDVIALTSEVSRVSQYLGLVTAQMDSLLQSRSFPFQTRVVTANVPRGMEKLSTLRSVVGYTEKLLMMYPRIAGFRNTQTYLVLLQNSMELRPTGGFIGSYIVLSFADGKVSSMDVRDVYSADGQLKGHIDPPLPIREILGQEHWYLRDSNWNPDFEQSGNEAAWFYEKEIGERVDGVIAVSLPMVTSLLRVTGPIELTDFNERISESNFFAKSLLYTEKNFFPGSTQKKDFLGALTSALLTRVTTDRSISAGLLLSAITQSILSRDIQFYFVDRELQALVTQWGWNGGMSSPPCRNVFRDLPCVNDSVGIVDANLGVNKSNFFVTKQAVSRITMLDTGDIDHTLTLDIRNASPVQGDGAGVYQSYLRLFVPQDSSVLSLLLDGSDVPKRQAGSVPPPSPYYMVEPSGSFAVIHVALSVRPHETRQLSVRWMRPKVFTSAGQSLYQFAIRKQAGVSVFPWLVTVQYPDGWRATGEGAVAKAGVLEYNTDLTKDAVYHMLFQK